jgi:hypothetical protein
VARETFGRTQSTFGPPGEVNSAERSPRLGDVAARSLLLPPARAAMRPAARHHEPDRQAEVGERDAAATKASVVVA